MPAGLTYDSITTQTVSGTSTTSISMQNIPSTYTDLVIVCSIFWSNQDANGIQFNGDTGSNYSAQQLVSDINSVVSSDSTVNAGAIALGRFGTNSANPPFTVTPLTFGAQIIHINNYANTGSFKATLSRHSNQSRPPYGVGLIAGLWKSTAAINRIDLVCDGTSYIMPGSTITLYGITAA